MVSGRGLSPAILGRRRPAEPLLPGGDPAQAGQAAQELRRAVEGGGERLRVLLCDLCANRRFVRAEARRTRRVSGVAVRRAPRTVVNGFADAVVRDWRDRY